MGGLLGQILSGVVGGALGRGGLGGGLGGALGGGMGRRRGGGNMVMNGLLIALAAKAAHSYMQQRNANQGAGSAGGPGAQPRTSGGGLDDMLGGILSQGGAGGGLGGILGGLGGAGALGALLNQLRAKGFGDQVDSWVKPGPKRLMAPEDLEHALGPEEIDALAEETGVPRQALLTELSQALPEAVDELTPQGQEPTDDDLTRFAGVA